MNSYRFEVQKSVVFCLSVDGEDEADARQRLARVLEQAVEGLIVSVPDDDELDGGGAHDGAIYIEDIHTAARTAIVRDTEEDEEAD